MSLNNLRVLSLIKVDSLLARTYVGERRILGQAPSQPGLDNRSRDDDCTIRQKRGDTLVRTLRDEYGQDFAQGARSDMKLETLLERTGMESLSQYLRAGKPAVPPNRS